jgi:lipoate-protein ligase A
MKLVGYKNLSGKENMALDEKLLDEAIEFQSEPILRFYSWSEPTLSYGKNQIMPEASEFPMVKRITGGRALLHDKELTYCFICHQDFLENGQSVINSYKEISNALVLGFSSLGVELSFPSYKKVSTHSGYCMNLATGSDLSYQNKKFIGSAQARKRGYILQHGSILLDYDKDLLEKIFSENVENVVALREIDSSLCDFNILIPALCEGFEQNFNQKFFELK